MLITGCTGNGEDPATSEQAEKSSARAELERKRQCSKNFQSVYQILRPSRENMNTELRSAMSLLNQWFDGCAEFSGEKLSADDAAMKGVVSTEEVVRLNGAIANLLDVYYLRDQLLSRAIMEQVVEAVPSDIEKVREVFAYTQRNITRDPLLIDARLYHFLQTTLPETVSKTELSKLTIPRTLEEIFLSGRGSDADLTWVFTALLQQLGIESILVSSAKKTTAETDAIPFLVLVPVEKKILIFCPAAGLELLPKQSTKETSWTPEELAKDFSQIFSTESIQAIGEKNILAKMKKADWKQPEILLPFSPLRVSPRTEVLQLELVGEKVCRVFQPLHSLNGEQGIVERFSVVTDKLFPGSSITFWDYPRQMYEGVMTATPEIQQLRTLCLATLNKTVRSLQTNESEKSGRTVTAKQVKRMQMSRVDQILGKESNAIPIYMKLRLQRGVGGNPTVELMKENLLRALQAEDALYWTATCQFENGEFLAAGNTLVNYLKRFPEGRWLNSALELLADAQAKRGRFQSAFDTLEQINLPEPATARQLLKLKEWKAKAGK